MIILNIVSMFLLVLPLNPQLDRQPIVYVKHLEPPLHYPALARAVRFHGTVIVKLTIGTDGVVLGAESSPQDSNMVGFPLLRDETAAGLLAALRRGSASIWTTPPADPATDPVFRFAHE